MILWGMGISQHIHGTDNARCLIALALMTGQIGRPGTGLHPLRGQNNVQGASDAGLIPMMYPDYQRVDEPKARARFEKAWGMAAGSLDAKPGLTVVEVMHAIKAGKVRGMYVMGENPAMSDPDANHARESLAALDHLVVQDIFLTETAYLADVILPASAFPEKTGSFTNTDRLVQMGRQAIDPPGDATPGPLDHPGDRPAHGTGLAVRPRVRGVRRDAPHHAQHRRHHLGAAGPRACRHLSLPQGRRSRARRVVFVDDFPRESGRGRFVPADIIPADERPDARVPDGADHRPPARTLAHRQHDAARDGAGRDRARSGGAGPSARPAGAWACKPGDVVTIESRRGSVSLYARADDSSPRGAVFVPFCYYEAAANKLTNAALDPFAKIPEFKYCAVRVTPGGPQPQQSSFGGGQALANAIA